MHTYKLCFTQRRSGQECKVILLIFVFYLIELLITFLVTVLEYVFKVNLPTLNIDSVTCRRSRPLQLQLFTIINVQYINSFD